MMAEIRRRLKPGAPFVAVHLSVADGDPGDDGGEGGARERDLWLSRYSEFQVASGMDSPPAWQVAELQGRAGHIARVASAGQLMRNGVGVLRECAKKKKLTSLTPGTGSTVRAAWFPT